MKNFKELISSLLSNKNNPENLKNVPIDFVKSRKGIVKELILSRQSGNAVGVYSRVMGEGMFLTVVEHLDLTPKEEVITFNQYDMSGVILSRYQVSLDEIQIICPINRQYRHPVFSGTKARTGTIEMD